MSIEEVERIMDETQDSIEYQRVSPRLMKLSFSFLSVKHFQGT